MDDHPIILFDGICNLCNAAVQFVIKHDKKKQFMFASLQSKAGQSILSDYGLGLTGFKSFILVENKTVYTRSSAALRLSRKLDGILPGFYAFMIIPKFIRDGLYNLVARNRYSWFGKKESCMIPSQELKARFLD